MAKHISLKEQRQPKKDKPNEFYYFAEDIVIQTNPEKADADLLRLFRFRQEQIKTFNKSVPEAVIEFSIDVDLNTFSYLVSTYKLWESHSGSCFTGTYYPDTNTKRAKLTIISPAIHVKIN